MPESDVEYLMRVVNSLKIGKFRARVLTNQHDEKPGWLQLQPIHKDGRDSGNTFWAEPCVPLAGPDCQCFLIPDVESLVWYEHIGGDPNHKVWTGCYWAPDNVLEAADNNPQRKLLRMGDLQILCDQDEGTITLQNSENTKIVMTSDTIMLEAANVIQKSNSKELKVSASGFDALNGALKVV